MITLKREKKKKEKGRSRLGEINTSVKLPGQIKEDLLLFPGTRVVSTEACLLRIYKGGNRYAGNLATGSTVPGRLKLNLTVKKPPRRCAAAKLRATTTVETYQIWQRTPPRGASTSGSELFCKVRCFFTWVWLKFLAKRSACETDWLDGSDLLVRLQDS